MPVEIRVPPLGESLVDAVVGTWLKSEGDAVSRGDTLLELETDKVNLDVAATEDGVLSSIARNEGDVVVVGEVLGTITEGAAASNGAQATEPAPAAEAAAPATPIQVAAAPATESAADAAGRAAPAVRRLAEEHNINLATIPGTGPGGRVTREDVMAAAVAACSPRPRRLHHPLPPQRSQSSLRRQRPQQQLRPQLLPSRAAAPKSECGCPAVARPSPPGWSRLSRPRPC